MYFTCIGLGIPPQSISGGDHTQTQPDTLHINRTDILLVLCCALLQHMDYKNDCDRKSTSAMVHCGRHKHSLTHVPVNDCILKQNTRGHFLGERCKRTAIEIFQTHALPQIPLPHFPPPAIPCRYFHSCIFQPCNFDRADFPLPHF